MSKRLLAILLSALMLIAAAPFASMGGAEDELQTIVWYYPGTVQPDQQVINDALNEYLSEKINTNVTMSPIDWSIWSDRSNLLVATGEEFDIIFTASWSGYANNAGKGGYVDITDYWFNTDIMDDYKAILDDVFVTGALIGGKLYAVPGQKEAGMAPAYIYRADMAQEAGVDFSKIDTLEDFGPEVFAKIHDMFPDVIVTFIFPEYCNATAETAVYSLGLGDLPVYMTKEGKVVYYYESEAMKDALRLAYEWNKAGYICDEAILENTSIQDASASGLAFSHMNVTHPGKVGELKQSTGMDWGSLVVAPPIAEVNGAMFAVSHTTADVERSLKFLNLLNSDKYVNNLVNFGIEGANYVFVDEAAGIIMNPDGVTSDTNTYAPASGWEFGNQLINYVYDFESPTKWAEYAEWNKHVVDSPAFGFVVDAEPVVDEIGAILNVYSEYGKSLKRGAIDPEQFLPEMTDKYYANGLQKVIDEIQAQYDAFVAAK